MEWSYFNKFDSVMENYLPCRGQGETFAEQVVTAINKIIYKWYNDGDVYDNHYALKGWANDLSSYANWLFKYAKAGEILRQIAYIDTEEEYEHILAQLADKYLCEEYLDNNRTEKQGDIYRCDGPFSFEEELNWGDDDEEDN